MAIHNGWAFSADENKKRVENANEFQRIKKENKFVNLEYSSGFNNFTKKIKALKPFTGEEMLLWADNGNLCFGGIFEGSRKNIEKVNQPGVYKVMIFTD